MLALAAVSAVVLSLGVLIGYSSVVSDGLDRMESGAQALLSHESAVDHLLLMLESGRLEPGDLPPPIIVGGMRTVFSDACLVPREGSTGRMLLGDMTAAVPLPAAVAGEVMVVGEAGGGLELLLFSTGDSLPLPGFPVTVCSELDGDWSAHPAPSGSGIAAVVAFGAAGGDSLAIVDPSGNVRHAQLSGLDPASVSVVTAALRDVGPLAVLSDGAGRGLMVGPGNGHATWLRSPPGTCPVLLPDGTLYGERSPEGQAPPAGAAILDLMTGDFDRDGGTDAAWVLPGRMTCYLSGRGELVSDRPAGMELLAWGHLDGMHGLGGLWRDDGGTGAPEWRKLFWSGFDPLPAAGSALAGLRGRITTVGGSSAALAGSDGCLRTFPSGSPEEVLLSVPGGVAGDFDGSGALDAAVTGEGVLTLHLDPAGSEGVLAVVTAETGPAGDGPILSEELGFGIAPGRPTIVERGPAS